MHCSFPLLHGAAVNVRLSLKQAQKVASEHRKQARRGISLRSSGNSSTLEDIPLHEYASSGCKKHAYKGEMHDPFHLCRL